jgi:hypothetical protein
VRRADPDRIREAQRAGLRARMVNYWHVLPDRADEVLDAWEAEAAARGIARNDAYRRLHEAWVRERADRG